MVIIDSYFWWALAKLVGCIAGYACFCWFMRRASAKAWVVVFSIVVSGMIIFVATVVADENRQKAIEAARG